MPPAGGDLHDFAAALRAYASELPSGHAVPVPRERLLSLLDIVQRFGCPSAVTPSGNDEEFTVERLAKRLHRKPSTVRGMISSGEFAKPPEQRPYKRRNREWMVPLPAVLEYEARQRTQGRQAVADDLSDWKHAKTLTKRRNHAA